MTFGTTLVERVFTTAVPGTGMNRQINSPCRESISGLPAPTLSSRLIKVPWYIYCLHDSFVGNAYRALNHYRVQ